MSNANKKREYINDFVEFCDKKYFFIYCKIRINMLRCRCLNSVHSFFISKIIPKTKNKRKNERVFKIKIKFTMKLKLT